MSELNKDWTGNSKSVFATLGASNHSKVERQQHDFYATDPAAVRQLLERETFAAQILEPCCGAGHIAQTLTEAGYSVQAQDLFDNGYGHSGIDFLEYRPDLPSDFDIITNPPYSLATEFVLHSLEILPQGCRAAMFLRLQFLETADRFLRLYSHGELEKVYVSSKRSHCAMNGDFDNMKGNAMCYAWFIWRKGYNGLPTLDWFNTPSVPQTTQQEFSL